MESPSMYPTTADYAQSAADDAKRENKKLAERVAWLEGYVRGLQKRLVRLENK